MIQSSFIYKVSKAYYQKGLTQQLIAERYGISRIKVSRLLAKAQKEKIVQISIAMPNNQFADLESELEEKFQLNEVIIVEDRTANKFGWTDGIGRAAADYISSIITGNETIAISWGQTLLNVANNLHSANFPDLKIVQMLGGIGNPQSENHGISLTRRFADRLGTRPILIQSPGIVKNKFVCDELINDFQVREALRTAAKADIAVVGLGSFSDNSLLLTESQNPITQDDYQDFKEKNIVGNIALRFINSSGEFVDTKIDDRVVGLSSYDISKIPRIIGVAGGKDKYEVIKAVAKGHLINVLITDNVTAKKLLKEN